MPQSIADQLQSIPMSSSLGQSIGRAHESAREQSHRTTMLEHLLLALTEDLDAASLMRACNVDIDRLGTDVSAYLGGLLEDMRAPPGTEPVPDPELLRVVEAARQAATQSRRRTIDGAIVLAAIVGDAKSPAAGLLKAHGMTFEEAIRTLQKASAQARSKQFSSSSSSSSSAPTARALAERLASEQAEKPGPAPAPAAAPARAASPSAAPAADAPLPGQSADDFLAAARARIQQRNTTAAKPESQTKSPAKPPQAEQEDMPLISLSTFTTSKGAAGADALPPLDGPEGPPAASSPPAVAAGPPPGGPPSPLTAPGAPPAPPEARPPPPPGPPGGFPSVGEGPPRLPGGSGAPPLHRLPDRPSRTDRADGSAPPLKRPPAPNGALPGQRRPAGEVPPRPPARPGAAPARSGQRAAAGPLMEAIPRRMRVGRAAHAQVRVGRDRVDNLIQLLMGNRAQHHPEAVAVRVLSVRLRAPDGGFSIEPATPETQWIETTPGQPHDEHVAWHWTVTPHRRGRRRLQLMVSARTVGRDGISAETAPPERAIEVRVRPRLVRRLVRWAVVVTLLGVGATLGRLSQDKLAQDLVDVGTLLVRNVLGLLRSSGFLAG